MKKIVSCCLISLMSCCCLGMQRSFILKKLKGTYYSNLPNDTNSPTDWYISMTELDKAWDICTSYSEPIGIADSGVYASHYDLCNQYNNSLSVGFIETPPSTGYHDHGTKVAGIVGAQGNNGIASCGVIWDSNLVSLRIDDSSLSYNESPQALIDAIEYASEASTYIPIINFSGGFYYNPNDPNSEITSQEITYLETAISGYNGLLICAAGNYSQQIGNGNSELKLYPQVSTLSNIIVVGASNQLDGLYSTSDWGSTSVDLFAPGDGILTTSYSLSDTTTISETSAAAPMVTGVVGLMKSVNPTLTNTQIKQLLLNSVDKTLAFKQKCVSKGRLNAYKAITSSLPSFVLGQSYSSIVPIQPNGTQWIRISGLPNGYSFSNSSSLNLSASLYFDTGGSSLTSGSSNGPGTFFNYLFSNSGTYYLKVVNNSSVAGYYTITTNTTHTHSYDSMYLWKNNRQHYSLCSCGAQRVENHVVSSGGNTCLLCGGYAEFGILNFTDINNYSYILTDSVIHPSGIIILGPIDYQNFISGQLSIENIRLGAYQS